MKNLLLFLAIALTTNFSHAQTGPGGVGNASGADGQPELKLWLIPDSLSLTDGNDVATWSDYSGNANDLTQGNSSYTPIFRENEASINNHDYLEFSKSDNRIVRNPFDIPTSAVAVFMVLKTSDSGDGLVSYAVPGQSNEYLFYQSNNHNTYIGGNSKSLGVNYSDGNWKIFAHQWRNTDGRLYLHIDGTEQANTTHRSGYTITENGSLAIGGEQDDVDGGYNADQAFQGDIAEIIMYGSSLLQADRVVIENYLAQKYGLDGNLTTDRFDPTDASYIVDMSGVGKEDDGVNELNSAGLVVTENANFDVGDYIFAAHDGTVNSIDDSPNAAASIEATWARNWYLEKSGTAVDATIAFDFSEGIDGDYPSNVTNYRLLYKLNPGDTYQVVTTAATGVQNGDQVYFDVTDGNISNGYYTLGTVDETDSPLDGLPARTWYTLISGDWDNWQTWTLDPSGALPDNPDEATPMDDPIDRVVILSGRSITVNDNNLQNAYLKIDGELNLQDHTGHSFNEIDGSGRLVLAADNFPSGDATHFTSAGEGEGTVVYEGTSYTLNQALSFYNLNIELDNETDKLTLMADYDIAGDFVIDTGEFQINDNSSTTGLNIELLGNASISEAGKVLTGTGNARHQFNFYGDLTNNGILEFTNRASADYNNEATNGIVDANFLNASKNQLVLCNNTSNFYRIEINKGTDATYELQILADDPAYFNLYGYARDGHGATAQLADNDNALGLIKGTVRLGNNVDVPVLNNTGNYNVSEGARLWVDGGSVAKNDGTAIVPYGKVLVSRGTLEAKVQSGLTTRDKGLIKITGGTLNTNQIRTSVLGVDNVGGYVQTGGTTNILGASEGETTNTDYYAFNLTYGGNVFNMSGGTLHIHDAQGKGGLFIASEESNQNVTGGTVIFELSDGNDFAITSTSPFWDVVLRNTSGGSGSHLLTNGEDVGSTDEDLAAQPLVVLNDLTIEDDAFLDHDGNDVTIGGDFSISEDAAQRGTNNYGYLYDGSKPNATTFNGDDDATFYIGFPDAEIEEWELYINRLVLNKPSGKILTIDSDAENNVYNVSGGWKARILRLDSVKVESGILDQTDYAIRLTGNVINYDQIGTYDGSTHDDALIMLAWSDYDIETTDNAIFGNVKLNVGNNQVVSFSSDVYIKRLSYRHGRIYPGVNLLKIDEIDYSLGTADDRARFDWDQDGTIQNDEKGILGPNDMFVFDGNVSDGGLSLKITGNGSYTFPIGIGLDGTELLHNSSKYTPAEVTVSNYFDDGYITITPVDGELQTTDLSGGDLVSYYWRVDYEDFSTEPTVKYEFYYYESDLDGSLNEASFVPGKVLDGGYYTRTYENDNTQVSDESDTDGVWNKITFNDHDGGGNGFTLERANYTAGESGRFIGTPDIYYSRNAFFGAPGSCESGCDIDAQDGAPYCGCAGVTWDFYDNDWNGSYNGGNGGSGGASRYVCWSLDDHDGDPANSLPGQGDIVEIGQCARVVFYDEQVTFAKVVNNGVMSFETNSNLDSYTSDLGVVDGEGTVFFDLNNGGSSPASLPDGDFGSLNNGFVSYSGSKFLFRIRDDANYQIPDNISIYPNVDFFSSSSNSGAFRNNSSGDFGDLRKFTLPDEDITMNGNLIIQAGARVLLNTTDNGDITVKGNMTLGTTPNPTGRIGALYFQNSGVERTFTVEGDILIRNGDHRDGDGDGANDHSIIEVLNGGSDGLEHTLKVYGNITLEDKGKLDLFGDDAVAVLEIAGESNNSFTQDGTSTDPELYRVVMNKGTDTTYSFTMNNDFNLNGPTSGIDVDKAITLENGKLILNHQDIEVNLNTGGDDFQIPSTAALEISDGKAYVNGGSGILLDGVLTLNGGQLDMSGGDNYIEYSASGNASLSISADTLIVGSQVRRSLTASEGVLKYNQTGGVVILGNDDAPENDRAILEVLNDDSEFNLTNGKLIIARAQDNPEIASLYLNPNLSNLQNNGKIQLGYNNTPSNEVIGIYSQIDLPNLRVDNSSGQMPTIKQWVVPLTISDSLIIDAGAELNADGRDLYVKGDIIVNGTFTPNGNTTYLNGADQQEITGSPAFYNLTKSTATTLALNNDVTVNNVFSMPSGTLVDNDNTFAVKGNINFGGTHNWGGSGNGIVLNGGSEQIMSGAGTYGLLAIDNAEGVSIDPGSGSGITITSELQLNEGIFDIDQYLLLLQTNANITTTNSFDENTLIQTNISFTDAGIKKEFPAISSTTDYEFPVGVEGKYTPVKFSIDNVDANGSIRLKAANEMQPTINDDDDECEPFNDSLNVLQYHWILEATGITNFTADMTMEYDPADALYDNPHGYDLTDYIAARILTYGTGANLNTWNKYDYANVDEPNNQLTFSFSGTDDVGISGDYTAGVEQSGPDGCNGAIPNKVTEFITVNSGCTWTNPNDWAVYDSEAGTTGPAGVDVPASGPRGAVIFVAENHTLTIPDNYISAYKTRIEAGATLDVGTTFGHRLGIVTGTGTLYLENGALPAGIYDSLFAAGGGTLHFGGNSIYTISGFLEVNNLKITGTSWKYFPNDNLSINGDLLIDNGYAYQNKNRDITIYGNIQLTSGRIRFDYAVYNQLIFAGNSDQSVTGEMMTPNKRAFNNIVINKPGGRLILNDNILIDRSLSLQNGIIQTGSANTFYLTASATMSGSSASSYINGPLKKSLNSSTDFTFPIGKNGYYRPLEIQNPAQTGDWTAEYFTNNSISDMGAGLSQVSPDNRWAVTGDNYSGTQTANVKLTWGTETNVSADPADYADLRVAYLEGGQWTDAGNSSYSGTQSSGYVISDAVSFSTKEFTIASASDNNPLPVSLIGFDASVTDNKVKVTWQTLNELNNDYFEVERSRDGVIFESVGRVQGAGNSSSLLNYSFTDQNPHYGISYYRLRQVDYDGTATVFPMQVVEITGIALNEPRLNIHPNPYTGGGLIVDIDGFDKTQDAHVMVADVSGNSVWSGRIAPTREQMTKTLQPQFERLKPGFYIIVVVSNDRKISTRVVKK
ncbi:T9SS type A sorting domain-containing protein [Salinivirga cyanobacteriivorans]|nr:T9SS type A sorting domain-containing protein [Salinivirga cyanobacteriivorans]